MLRTQALGTAHKAVFHRKKSYRPTEPPANRVIYNQRQVATLDSSVHCVPT